MWEVRYWLRILIQVAEYSFTTSIKILDKMSKGKAVKWNKIINKCNQFIPSNWSSLLILTYNRITQKVSTQYWSSCCHRNALSYPLGLIRTDNAGPPRLSDTWRRVFFKSTWGLNCTSAKRGCNKKVERDKYHIARVFIMTTSLSYGVSDLFYYVFF